MLNYLYNAHRTDTNAKVQMHLIRVIYLIDCWRPSKAGNDERYARSDEEREGTEVRVV